ncbi:MAG TPA: MFS transporter [Natronosporangium sp.]
MTAASSPDAGILVTWRDSPLPVKALLIGIFVQRLSSFVQVFLVLFLTNRGFAEVEAGVALGLWGAGSVVGVLVGGALADRLGPRLTIVSSLLGTAPLLVALLYADSYPLVLAAAGLLGLVSQAFRPAATTLLSTLTPKHRLVMLFAMVRFATNLGTTAAPLLGAALVEVSYSLLFWVEALIVLGYGAAVAVALPRRAPATGEPAAAAAADVGRRGYLAVLGDLKYLLFLAAVLLNLAIYMQYVSTLPVAMTAAGLNTWWYGAVLSLNGLVVITSELLTTKLTQRWPARVVALIGFLLLGAGLAAYTLPLGVAAFVIGTLIWSLAEIVAGPTVLAHPAAISPEHLRGRYIGLVSATFGLGQTIGPALGLAGWRLAGQQVWWWYVAACLVGAGLAWVGMTRPGGTTAQVEPAPPPEQEQPTKEPEHDPEQTH